jgi:hypothetical protein
MLVVWIRRAICQGSSVKRRLSTNCTFINYDAWLYHGIWSIHPPAKILPHTTVVFGSESSGLFTGTEGYVKYMNDWSPTNNDCPEAPGIHLYWDNPYSGSNSHDWELEAAWTDLHLTRSGGSGNNASVFYHLY